MVNHPRVFPERRRRSKKRSLHQGDMSLASSNPPKVKSHYNQQYKQIIWTIKDGKINQDEYVRINQNGKVREKKTRRNIPLKRAFVTFDGKSFPSIPRNHSKHNPVGRRARESIKLGKLANVPELMRRHQFNHSLSRINPLLRILDLPPRFFRQKKMPKIVSFNPNVIETTYPYNPARPVSNIPITYEDKSSTVIPRTPLASADDTSPAFFTFPISNIHDRMPTPFDKNTVERRRRAEDVSPKINADQMRGTLNRRHKRSRRKTTAKHSPRP